MSNIPTASKYMTGFGNDFATEALAGALPQGRNSPQKCAYGLYAEQLSGSPFTAPRGLNERSWLYRIAPSVKHSGPFSTVSLPFWKTAPDFQHVSLPIDQYRWSPPTPPEGPTTFLSGMRTMTVAGDAHTHAGMAASLYFINASMQNEYFYNADAEMLIVPQEGSLRCRTEFGVIDIEPAEIAIIPRGVKFCVELLGASAKGYLCENYGAKFTLPNRGPIGANCLANARDFLTPVAAFEDKEGKCTLTVKWGGKFFSSELTHSPLDVVAWHGNYAPYKYDLRNFSPVGALLFDHPDPSIFTVLSAPSGEEGTANIDFVIFPDRWQVAENTFRPPWFHMNIMSEFMGLIYGQYDAKPEGFVPGGVSLHNCMLAHGPDSDAFEKASQEELVPRKFANSLAFMFESRFPQHLTTYAAETEALQKDYRNCWSKLPRLFPKSS